MAKIDIMGNGIVLPEIRFTKYSMQWINAIVEQHNEEIGFYGVVERDGNIFTITDIFYPKHVLATSATCEIDPDGITDVMKFLLDKGRDEDIGKLKMWGHSHVNMGVGPSGQDESMGLELVNDNGDYLIRLIANKKGDMGITLFDLERNIKISELDYSIINTEEEDEIVVGVIEQIMSDGGLSNSDKIMDIDDAIRIDLIDDGYDVITDHVKDLMKDNLPAKTAYVSGFGKYNKPKAKSFTPPAKKKPISDYSHNGYDPYDFQDDTFDQDEFDKFNGFQIH